MKARLLLAMAAIVGGQLDDVSTYGMGQRSQYNKKSPFTEEELEKLATLSGKDKKQYVKELKEKYRWQKS